MYKCQAIQLEVACFLLVVGKSEGHVFSMNSPHRNNASLSIHKKTKVISKKLDFFVQNCKIGISSDNKNSLLLELTL